MPCWTHAHDSTVLHSADRVASLPRLDVRTGSGILLASVHSYLLVDTPNAAPSSSLDSCFCIVILAGAQVVDVVDPWTYAPVHMSVLSSASNE